MSKFIKVMTAKVEGFDVIRRFGIDILIQIIAVAGVYFAFNYFKEAGSDKLGASHFTISLVILVALTTFQTYKKKLSAMQAKGQKIS